MCGNGYGETRRLSAEGDGAYGYYEAQIAVLRTAYAAALTAEEQRRAAALLTEPVAPESDGARSTGLAQSAETVIRNGHGETVVRRLPQRLKTMLGPRANYLSRSHTAPPSTQRASSSARIDAVRAAEDAFKEADATYQCCAGRATTPRAAALANAKRERPACDAPTRYHPARTGRHAGDHRHARRAPCAVAHR